MNYPSPLLELYNFDGLLMCTKGILETKQGQRWEQATLLTSRERFKNTSILHKFLHIIHKLLHHSKFNLFFHPDYHPL